MMANIMGSMMKKMIVPGATSATSTTAASGGKGGAGGKGGSVTPEPSLSRSGGKGGSVTAGPATGGSVLGNYGKGLGGGIELEIVNQGSAVGEELADTAINAAENKVVERLQGRGK